MTRNLAADELDSLAPDAPFWAVGDVHGRYDLLMPLLDKLKEDDLPIILLGDYVNKGRQSAQVIAALRHKDHAKRIIALRGNHEEMFLRFLRRPWRTGRAFLRYGGRATLESFGVPDLGPEPELQTLAEARDHIRGSNPKLEVWLSRRPYVWQSGNVAALHAGADPDVALADQPQKGFAWGHANFTRRRRADGTWIVHGHRPVPEVEVLDRRIDIDTEAHKSGRLTAVRISAGRIDVR